MMYLGMKNACYICEVKKLHNLKVENYFLFGGFSEDLSQEDSLSDRFGGLLQRGKGGARIYTSFATKTR